MINDNEIGLCLSGGGAMGAFQIGVFNKLNDKGLIEHITAVSGTSAGALNAALFIQGNIRKAEDIWLDFRETDFLGVKRISSIKDLANIFEIDCGLNSKASVGFFNQMVIEKLLKKNISVLDICNSSIDCYITCYKSWTKRRNNLPIYINECDKFTPRHIQKFLLASAALPVIYPPVEINGETYLDGGVNSFSFFEKKRNEFYLDGVGNVPYKVLVEKGYKNIIVIDYVDSKLEINDNVNIINITPESKDECKKKGKKYLYGWFGTFDFKNISNMIEEGEKIAEKVLDDKKELLDKIKNKSVKKESKTSKWLKTRKIDNVQDFVSEMKKGSDEIIICDKLAIIIKALYSLHNNNLMAVIDIILKKRPIGSLSSLGMKTALSSIGISSAIIGANSVFLGLSMPILLFLDYCCRKKVIENLLLYEMYESVNDCPPNCVVLYRKIIR